MTADLPMRPGNPEFDQASALLAGSLKDLPRLPAKRSAASKPPKRSTSHAVATQAALAQHKRNAEGRNPSVQKAVLRKG